jgi:hypothetical protein
VSRGPINALSLALNGRLPHFEGNQQKNIRSWQWTHEKLLDESDFDLLIASDALDWVIVLVPEPK